jgi:hypothetical protein
VTDAARSRSGEHQDEPLLVADWFAINLCQLAPFKYVEGKVDAVR